MLYSMRQQVQSKSSAKLRKEIGNWARTSVRLAGEVESDSGASSVRSVVVP